MTTIFPILLGIALAIFTAWQCITLYDVHSHRVKAGCARLSCDIFSSLCKQKHGDGLVPCSLYNLSISVGGFNKSLQILLPLKTCPETMFSGFYDTRDPENTFTLGYGSSLVGDLLTALGPLILSWGILAIVYRLHI